MKKNGEYLTIPDFLVSRNKEGKITEFEEQLGNSGKKIKKIWLVFPEKDNSGYRFSIAVPSTSVFEGEIKGFKNFHLQRNVGKDGKEYPFYVNVEKKSIENGKTMWKKDESFDVEKRKWDYDKLKKNIVEQFNILNARKDKDGKDVPAFHYAWLPQDAYNNGEKQVPTCSVVPETHKDGTKSAFAGKIQITLPAYCKVKEFNVFDKDGKGSKEVINTNFAKFYVDRTYESNPEYTQKNSKGELYHPKDHDGLVAVALPDDSKILMFCNKWTDKKGVEHEAKSVMINANDLRESLKEDYKNYKKSLKTNDKDVSKIKDEVSKQAPQKETAQKSATKEKDNAVPFG